MTIANSVKLLANNRISVVRHGNGVPAWANHNVVKKFSNNQNERGDEMENTSFMRVEEVAQELGVSKSYAYKIVQKLNEELKSKGFLTISGRVNKQYFMERTCYGAVQKER